MTPEEVLAKMKELYPDRMENGQYHGEDTEGSHGAADSLLSKALRELGYGEAMDIYDHAYMWFA